MMPRLNRFSLSVSLRWVLPAVISAVRRLRRARLTAGLLSQSCISCTVRRALSWADNASRSCTSRVAGSMRNSTWPASTRWPCSTRLSSTLPSNGAVRVTVDSGSILPTRPIWCTSASGFTASHCSAVRVCPASLRWLSTAMPVPVSSTTNTAPSRRFLSVVIEGDFPTFQRHAQRQVELGLGVQISDQRIKLGVFGVAQVGLETQHLKVGGAPGTEFFPLDFDLAPRQLDSALRDFILAPACAEVAHYVVDVAFQLLTRIGDTDLLVLDVDPRAHLGLSRADVTDRDLHLHASVAVPRAVVAIAVAVAVAIAVVVVAVGIADLVGPGHQVDLPAPGILGDHQVEIGLLAAQQGGEVFRLLGLRQVEGLALVDSHRPGLQRLAGADGRRQVQRQQAQQGQAACIELVLRFFDAEMLGGDVSFGLHDFELGHAACVDQCLVHLQQRVGAFELMRDYAQL